jgi:hypothetical protein
MILKFSIAAWLVALTFPIRFWANLCLLGKRAFLQEASWARAAGGIFGSTVGAPADGSAVMLDALPIPPNEGWAELHDGE